MYGRWQHRIARFIQAVFAGDLRDTYQTHHPGVTFMWLAGLSWEVCGVVDGRLHLEKLRLAVFPVACVGALLPVASYWAMNRLLGQERRMMSLLGALLLAPEPLLVAHSGQAHLDMLLTSFGWLALLLAIIAQRESSVRWAVGAGTLLGLALLTKLTAAGHALGIATLFIAPWLLERANWRRDLRVLSVIVLSSLVTVVASWPALWVAPEMVLERLLQGGALEVNKVGPAMFLGDVGKLSLPFWAYGVFLVFLATPEFFLPAALLVPLWSRLHPRVRLTVLQLALGALPLAVAILSSSHVGVRYMLPLFPLLGTLSGMALVEAGLRAIEFGRTRTWLRGAALGLCVALVAGRTARLAALAPLPIAYCSRWTGMQCDDVFHMGWGEGLKQAAQLIQRDRVERARDGSIAVFSSRYPAAMALWAPIEITTDLERASFLVDYRPDWQRRTKESKQIAKYVKKNRLSPLHKVVLDGRTYVRIYAGPRY
jgi:4-amino-4-deoxy-L-arabinose transferase-like glycosyltransferase